MPPMAFTGVVTKVGFMNKTATVTVARYLIHPRTKKRIQRHTKILTHDPANVLKMDDTVVIRNCAPISARKRFKLERIIKSPETELLEKRAKKEADLAAAQAEEQMQNASPKESATL